MSTYADTPPFEEPEQDLNTYPYGQMDLNIFYYDHNINFNDYTNEGDTFPLSVMVSPKTRRYELYTNLNSNFLEMHYLRRYNNPLKWKKGCRIDPYQDWKNEELREKIKFKSNYQKFIENYHLRDSETEQREFLRNKTDSDSFDISEDLTEDDLDQAIFEASYAKPANELDENKCKFNNF